MRSIPFERRGIRLAAAALSGLADVACFAPFDAFWLAPLVCAALFSLLQRTANAREAALTGFTFGLAFFLGGVSWIYVSLSVFGGMPWWLAGTAALLFCAAMALYPALASWTYRRWQPAAFWQQALHFAALFAAVDWLRSWIFTGFPWLALGYSQTPPSPLAGYAPLLGVFGLSLLTAFSGPLLLDRRRGWPGLLALALGGAALLQIEWTQPSGEPVTVALVQGNVPQEMKFRPEAVGQTLLGYRQLVAEHPAQLTLLPETALPYFIEHLPTDYLQSLDALAARQGGDLLAGTLTGERERYFNSAVSFGMVPGQVYSKQHLVPFGEFIPAGFAWFMAYANIPMSAFSRGEATQAPLQLGGLKVAVNICYEDVFGSEIAPAARRAQVLANLSNTAWFGDSLAQPQHLQIARLRALETGRPMLRATNTGMTAIIDAHGRVVSALPPFTTAVLTGEVQGRSGETPYLRFGDWPALLLIALALLAARYGRGRQSAAND